MKIVKAIKAGKHNSALISERSLSEASVNSEELNSPDIKKNRDLGDDHVE